MNRIDEEIEKLTKGLKDPDPHSRWTAAMLLRDFGPWARGAVSALREARGDQDPRVRHHATAALNQIEPFSGIDTAAFNRIIDPIGNIDFVGAIQGLSERQVDGDIERLVGQLKGLDPLCRWITTGTLMIRGPRAYAALPALYKALSDEDARVRVGAAGAIALIDLDKGQAALPMLIEALRHPDKDVREVAAETLEAIGPRAKAAIPALRVALRDEDVEVRYRAARALMNLGPTAAPAVGELIRCLQDDSEKVRTQVAETLGWIGPEAGGAVPALLAVLDGAPQASSEEPQEVRKRVAEALAWIAPDDPQVALRLAKHLADGDENLRLGVALALAEMGSGAKAALPALVQALRDDHGGVSYYATIALGKLGPEGRPAVPTLKELLKDPNCGHGQRVAEALARIEGTKKGTKIG